MRFSNNAGEIPIYEPGLEELVKKNKATGRIEFTTNAAGSMEVASSEQNNEAGTNAGLA